MSGIKITIPGLTLPAGSRTTNPRHRGVPTRGLVNLYLFEDGSLTAPVSSAGLETAATVGGGGTASLLTGGGGINLLGIKHVSAPTINFTSAWTLVTGGMVDITTSVTAPAEAVVGVLSFSQYFTQGSALFARKSPAPWDTSTALTVQQRPATSGGQGTAIDLSGTKPTPADPTLWVHSFNGISTLSSSVYSATGALLLSGSQTIDPVTATTSSGGAVVTSLNPIVGNNQQSQSNGSFSAEMFAIYNRVIDARDITSLVEACTTLGAARGRAWA